MGKISVTKFVLFLNVISLTMLIAYFTTNPITFLSKQQKELISSINQEYQNHPENYDEKSKILINTWNELIISDHLINRLHLSLVFIVMLLISNVIFLIIVDGNLNSLRRKLNSLIPLNHSDNSVYQHKSYLSNSSRQVILAIIFPIVVLFIAFVISASLGNFAILSQTSTIVSGSSYTYHWLMVWLIFTAAFSLIGFFEYKLFNSGKTNQNDTEMKNENLPQ